MSDIPINLRSLKIARENAGYSTLEATHKVVGKNSKTDRVREWENSEKTPTWKQLKATAEAYQVNVFVLTNDEELEKNRHIKDFRKVKSGKDLSLNTKKYINFLLQRQQCISNILKKKHSSKNQLVGCGEEFKNSEIKLAEFIAKKLSYKYLPNEHDHLKYLISLVEEKGVFIMKTLSYWGISIPEMRGVYLKDDYAPIIAINRRDAKSAQLFTLAHEIAHLFINCEAISNIDFKDSPSNKGEEAFCSRVAASLLLPESLISKETYSLNDIGDIAKEYQVSQLFVFYRLKSLGSLSAQNIREYENVILKRSEQPERLKKLENLLPSGKPNKGNYNNNMKDSNGRLFNKFVSSLYFENKMNAFEASKFLKFSIDKV